MCGSVVPVVAGVGIACERRPALRLFFNFFSFLLSFPRLFFVDVRQRDEAQQVRATHTLLIPTKLFYCLSDLQLFFVSGLLESERAVRGG